MKEHVQVRVRFIGKCNTLEQMRGENLPGSCTKTKERAEEVQRSTVFSGSPKETEWTHAEPRQGDRQRTQRETTGQAIRATKIVTWQRNKRLSKKTRRNSRHGNKVQKLQQVEQLLQTEVYISYKISRSRKVLLEILTHTESVWNTKDIDIKYVFVSCA